MDVTMDPNVDNAALFIQQVLCTQLHLTIKNPACLL